MAFRFDLAKRDVAQLDACVRGIYLPGIYIGRAQYGAPVALGPSGVRNDYWVHLPIQGVWEAAIGEHTFVCDGRHAVVSSPTQEVMLRSNAGAARLSLSVTSEALKRQLTALLGEPPVKPLEFVPTMNLANSYGSRFANMLTSAVIEFEQACAVHWSPTTMIEFAEFAVTNLLIYQPHTYSAALRRPDRLVTPRDIRRAVDYLEAHLDSPLTVADLVAASQVTGRTLFQHFRDFTGISPMRYLRNARLAKVRNALLRAEPEDSVTVIAMGCGFTHMSRFALEYRQRFGERPSDTLRRARNGRENVRGGGLAGSATPLVQGLRRSVIHGCHRERAAVEARRRLLRLA
jgi:AraC-like DNA-binding protein